MKYYFESITPAHLIGEPEISFVPPGYKNTAYFKSMDSLNKAINKYFGCWNKIDYLKNQKLYLKDIAENYKVKLMFEKYEYCSFPTLIGDKQAFITFKLEV